MRRLLKRLPWIALGAAGAWFYDGDRGADRRRRLKDKAAALVGPTSEPDDVVLVNGVRERAA